jgi:fructose-bisphosphate aldolase class 1
LYQSCHILHKRGQYYITHFKELFALDGKPSSIIDNDIERRNAIAKLLEQWGLVTIVNPEIMVDKIAEIHQIKIIPFREKDDWQLISKYNIGKKSPE